MGSTRFLGIGTPYSDRSWLLVAPPTMPPKSAAKGLDGLADAEAAALAFRASSSAAAFAAATFAATSALACSSALAAASRFARSSAAALATAARASASFFA